jgi:outer membrane protein assembly factor BamB
MSQSVLRTACLLTGILLATPAQWAADWTMKARDASHNPVCSEDVPPIQFPEQINDQPIGPVKWITRLGVTNAGEPVISGGLIWVGTNFYDRNQPDVDASILKCLRESDGKELAEYVIPRDPRGRAYDWPMTGLSSSPLVEGDRLWFCTNRSEVVCLDISELLKGTGGYRVVWKVDMQKEFKVEPVGIMLSGSSTHCSPAGYGDWIYVNTGNARRYGKIPAPDAPSLICFRKSDGHAVWTDNSPGNNLIAGQQGNPLVMEVDGKPIVVIGQGDGWMRGFDAATGEVLWTFDINLKSVNDRFQKKYIVATPMAHEGRIYFMTGRQRESSEGVGRLCCLDPSKHGDVSSELIDSAGRVTPNPNSAVIWEYRGEGRPDESRIHCSLSTVAVKDRLLIATDIEGFVHCFDAATGDHLWDHDCLATIMGSPLIVGNVIYIATDDGEITELALAREKAVIADQTSAFADSLETSPVFANGTLYLLGRYNLYAVSANISPR